MSLPISRIFQSATAQWYRWAAECSVGLHASNLAPAMLFAAYPAEESIFDMQKDLGGNDEEGRAWFT